MGSATGRAYVYLGGSSGLSTTAATTLTGPDGAEGYFGDSVASAGDVNGDGYGDLLVGAPGASGGRAYVYLGSASGLGATPATALTNPEGTYGRFANSIASAGDVNGDGYADVVIGASYTWRTYLYLGGAAGLGGSPAATIATPDGLGGDVVASAGDVNGDGHADVVVGSVNADDHAGRAYLYLGGASGLGATPATTLSGPDGGDGQFGFAIANAGDVNGDGYSDVVAGAIALGGYTGRVYLYLGGASGLGATPATTLPGFDGGYGWFGYSIAGAGDVNGDGYGDVVIGAVGASDFAGRSYVYLGGAGGLATTPAATLTGTESNGSFGYSVAGAGDVNGDGYVDVLVGASSAANGNGRAYLYLGGASGLSLTPATTLSGPDSGPGYFGTSVASTADVPAATRGSGHPERGPGGVLHRAVAELRRVEASASRSCDDPSPPLSTSRFFRYQLRTTDQDAARAFYSDILGERFWGPDLAPAPLPERAIAMGARPHWLGHVHVDDVEATVARIVAAGGQPRGPTLRSADGSPIAVLRDPFGAGLAVSSEAVAPSPSPVAWHLLQTDDEARAFALYAALFGWTALDSLDLGPELGRHQMFSWDDSREAVGSVANGAQSPHIHPQWLFFFPVPDLGASLSRVRSLGGLALRPIKTPSGDLAAPCDDPQGAAFGLIQVARAHG